MLQWVSNPARDSQTVWSQWVHLGAGNEHHQSSHLNWLDEEEIQPPAFPPCQDLTEGEKREAGEKVVAGRERCLMIEGENEG